MNMQNKIEKTAEFARVFFQDEFSGHDWWHTYRVWQIAKNICQVEKADNFIVEMAALLHDVDDHKLAKAGSDNARKWLEDLKIDQQNITKILEVIRTVSFGGGEIPETIEGKIVQDADRLDGIGAMGISRVFAYGGHKNLPIHDPAIKPRDKMSAKEYLSHRSTSINHFYEKLLRLKEILHTETAKRAAENRQQIMEKFLEDFLLEWDGKDIK